ncbi:MAG TPA: hypothetical protein VMG10_02095 [Gemmataceae bacterium]|nr:hypothetical protein [Gemmataceae bacterium]
MRKRNGRQFPSWVLPSELKEPDFDALRGRADFQKLVAEVENKGAMK